MYHNAIHGSRVAWRVHLLVWSAADQAVSADRARHLHRGASHVTRRDQRAASRLVRAAGMAAVAQPEYDPTAGMFWRNERKLVSELEQRQRDTHAGGRLPVQGSLAPGGTRRRLPRARPAVLRVVLGAPPAGRRVEPGDDMSRHGAGQIYTEERTPPKFDLAVVAMAGPVAEGKAVYLRCQESWDAVGLGEFHCVEMAMSTTDATSDMEDAARLGRRGELAMAEAEAASILEYEWAG